MSTQITKRGEFMNPVALQQIEQLSQKLIGSQALPNTIKNGSQLAMVLMAGYESGMTPMESINSYYIVNGKVTIWGQALIRQLRKGGWSIEWNESTEDKATVTIKKGRDKATETYTFDEAVSAGLTSKDTWKKYPTEMLRHKAIARAVRFTCPEVLNGHYVTEEIDADARVVDVTSQPEQPKKELPKKMNAAIHASWKDLMDLREVPEEKRDALRKATLAKLYSAASNNDLTVQEAGDFLTKIGEQINELKNKATESPESDDNTPDEPEGGNEEKTSEEKPQEATEPVIDDEEYEVDVTSLPPGVKTDAEVTVDEIDEVLNELPEDMGGNKKVETKQAKLMKDGMKKAKK